jgi:uncharacterized protein (UPF0335 family)
MTQIHSAAALLTDDRNAADWLFRRGGCRCRVRRKPDQSECKELNAIVDGLSVFRRRKTISDDIKDVYGEARTPTNGPNKKRILDMYLRALGVL